MTLDLVTSQQAWNEAALKGSGHLLQSWNWGSFKSRFGWEVERVAVAAGTVVAQAQILFRSRGPVSVGYIPRGPIVPTGDPELAEALIRQIDAVCQRRRALYTMFETETELPFQGTYKDHGFVLGANRIQPARTVKVALRTDEELLAQMRQNTRYSVRLASRCGVIVQSLGNPWAISDFYRLLADTSERNSFGIHSQEYYAAFLETFGQDAVCIFADSEGHLAASLIAARFGKEAIYMYGASSTEFRQHGAAFLLQFEAMKWARAGGCERYDLWGIPVLDPESISETGDSIAGTKGDDWRGLYRFKTGFGGDIVSYPPALERRNNRLGTLLAKRVIKQQRGDS
ncbi:MAG TPA: peptidoglycan bridge formation glycyltransferase FemA/FemB family protein [Thermomicrobiales bacterium]|nr:peptidoglycan bridge formation glycyltransferase FemA/FemB family protein [Thermomicrobiales bacterium]